MKKTFTQSELLHLCGCWKKNMDHSRKNAIDNLTTTVHPFYHSITKECTIIDILYRSDISLQDKRWFLFNSCDLTLLESQLLGLASAKAVVSNYNKQYPNDNRISLCINITARYLKGLVKIDTLIKYQKETKSAAKAATLAAASAAKTVTWSAAESAASAAKVAILAAESATTLTAWSATTLTAWSAAASAASATLAAESAVISAAWSATEAAASATESAASATESARRLINYWIKTINTFNNE